MAIIMPHDMHQRTSGNSGHQHVDSSSLVTLKVARNHCNFRCARSRVAILLASLIFIISRWRQTKRILLTSMLCSSVVKVFFVPKRGTEIDEDLLCQNMSKARF